MNNMIQEMIKSLTTKTITTRREIHKNPELGFEEYKTADLICKRLDDTISVDFVSLARKLDCWIRNLMLASCVS